MLNGEPHVANHTRTAQRVLQRCAAARVACSTPTTAPSTWPPRVFSISLLHAVYAAAAAAAALLPLRNHLALLAAVDTGAVAAAASASPPSPPLPQAAAEAMGVAR